MDTTRKGSVLVFVLMLTIMMGGAVAVVLGTTVVQARVTRETDKYVIAFHNANAAIEYLKYYIRASRYASNGRNEWLLNHSSDTGREMTSSDEGYSEIASLGATVTITNLEDSAGLPTPWYRIESSVPAGNLGVNRVVEVWVREREPFSEYMFFVGGGIRFGETTVAGRVHSNGLITFSRGARNPGTNEPAKFWDDVTSTSGYSFLGAGSFEELFRIYNEDGSLAYTSEHDFNVAARPMPETNDIDSLWDIGNNGGYNANSSIEFETIQDSITGEYVTKVYLDDPAHINPPLPLPLPST